MAELTKELSQVKGQEPAVPGEVVPKADVPNKDVRVHPNPAPAGKRPLDVPTGTPTVIVDDLHIVYRVYGAASDNEKGNAVNALTRLVKRQGRPQMKEVHAVKGVSFVSYHGDAIGVVGRNGSGKSTLLRAIAGLLPPRRGRRLHRRPALAARRQRGADERAHRRAQHRARLATPWA